MRPRLFKQFQVILMMLTVLVIVTHLDFEAVYQHGPQQPVSVPGSGASVTTTAWPG
jgi:hypothetical protein